MGLHDMGLGGAVGFKDMASHAIQGVIDKIRRNAIGYSICGICALAVLILATSAAVMALVPLVGAVYSQLIVAGVFVVVIVGTMLWLQRPATKTARPLPLNSAPLGATAAAPDGAQRQMQFAQIAMILEALALGYSLSRKR